MQAIVLFLIHLRANQMELEKKFNSLMFKHVYDLRNFVEQSLKMIQSLKN